LILQNIIFYNLVKFTKAEQHCVAVAFQSTVQENLNHSTK